MTVQPSTTQHISPAPAAPFWLALALVWAAHLLVVWQFDYFPSQDGPAHVSTAVSLAHLDDADLPAFATYFEANWRLASNQVVAVVLMTLTQVFEPHTAEKVLVSLYVVLLPLSMLYAMTANGRHPNFAIFLIFPFVFSRVLHLGFYNFSLGLVTFLFCVGYYLRVLSRPSPMGYLTLAGLVLITYALHVFAAACALLAIVSLILVDLWIALSRAGPDAPRASSRRDWLRPWLPPAAVAAICTMVVGLVLAFTPELVDNLFQFEDLLKKLGRLASLSAVISFSAADFLFGLFLSSLLAVLAGCALVALLRRRRLGEGDDLLLVTAIFVLAYFLVPGIAFIPERFMLCVFFMLLLWLGTRRPSGIWRPSATVVCAAVAVAALAYRVPTYIELNARLAPLAHAAEHVEPGATLYAVYIPYWPEIYRQLESIPAALGLAPWPDGTPALFERVHVTEHAVGHLASARRLVNLSNYQTRRGFFPLQLRLERDPDLFLELERDAEDQAKPGLAAYAAYSGSPVDYLLVWETDETLMETQTGPLLLEEIHRDYTLVFTSSVEPGFRLYRHRR